MRLRWILSSLALFTLLAAPVARAQGEVELVEPGHGPRQPLRHQFHAGQRQSLQLRIQSRMHLSAGAREQNMVVPAMLLELALGPTRVNDGHMRYAFRISRLSASGGDPEARAQIEEQLSALVGTTGTAEVDDRGDTVAFEYELPDSVPEQIRQQAASLRSALTQLLPRFPREPVGVGAVWRIRDTLQMPQMEVQMQTVYTLRSREGGRIELDVRLAMAEGNQLPDTVQMDVSGSGRQRFELGSLEVHGRIQSDAEMHVQSPRGPMQIRMQTRTEVRPTE